jgi:hypothetical protein
MYSFYCFLDKSVVGTGNIQGLSAGILILIPVLNRGKYMGTEGEIHERKIRPGYRGMR